MNENNMKSTSDDASETSDEPSPDTLVGDFNIISFDIIMNFFIIIMYMRYILIMNSMIIVVVYVLALIREYLC